MMHSNSCSLLDPRATVFYPTVGIPQSASLNWKRQGVRCEWTGPPDRYYHPPQTRSLTKQPDNLTAQKLVLLISVMSAWNCHSTKNASQSLKQRSNWYTFATQIAKYFPISSLIDEERLGINLISITYSHKTPFFFSICWIPRPGRGWRTSISTPTLAGSP